MGLFFTRLADDPLEELQGLANLEYIYLYQAYDGEQIRMVQGGFKKLKLLSLRNLINLRALVIDQEALPNLLELCIGPSPLVSEVPSGIYHLRALKTLVFYDMPRELGFEIQPQGGEGHWKVAHIQTILFSYKIRGQQYKSYSINDLTSAPEQEREICRSEDLYR